MAVARKHVKKPEPLEVEKLEAPLRAAPDPKVPPKRPKPDSRVLISVALLVIGVVFVMLGWYGAAHTNIFTEQIPYLISGGLLGVALIIIAGVIASNSTLERETKLLREDLRRAMDALSYSGRPSVSLPERVLIVPGGRTYHVPGCPIPEGKDVTTMTLEEARAARFTECKLCGASS
ncbi:MAG: hypothetical protein ACYDCC_06920 [Actinomycetota bacterium]